MSLLLGRQSTWTWFPEGYYGRCFCCGMFALLFSNLLTWCTFLYWKLHSCIYAFLFFFLPLYFPGSLASLLKVETDSLVWSLHDAETTAGYCTKLIYDSEMIYWAPQASNTNLLLPSLFNSLLVIGLGLGFLLLCMRIIMTVFCCYCHGNLIKGTIH